MMKPGRTKTWIGLMFLNGQGCVGINFEFFSASSGVGLRIHSLVSETRLGQVRSQPDQRVLKFFQTWWDPIQKIVMQNVPNDMLVLCFLVFFCQNLHEELPCKSTQKWHDYPFRFTIKTKPVFHYKIGFRNSHFTLHTCSCFSCKTPNLAGDPAPGCTSLLTAHWSRLAKWSNTNKYTHCEGSHLKHKCSLIHSDENFIIVWVFLMKIPRLLEDFLDINRAVFVCVRIRNSIVTSCSIKLSAVLLIACHFCHEVRNLPLAPKAKRRGSCLWMYGKKTKKKNKQTCYPYYPRWSRSQN